MNVKDIGKNIELLNIIGKGSYGNVYLGLNNLNNQYYAIKVISKSQLQSRIVYQYFNNEIYILKHINHPNIVKYISLVEQKKDYWLVIEYCNGGSLVKALKYHLTKFNKPIPEDIVRYIVKNILTAVIYLNNKNIIHRDIKSDNILLHYENEQDLLSNNFIKAKIKLIDFGFARYLDENELAGSLVGTPMYMDPNVLKTFLESKSRVVQGFYDQKVDVWSLGILTYELLIGIVPFMSKDIKGLFQNVNKRDFYIPKEEKRDFYLTEAAIRFIDKTLNIDPNVRPLPAELINDPWFNNEDGTIYQMKTDEEIKLLNNKKLFINFWKPKVSKGFNKISMKEKLNLKKKDISLNLDKEKKKKIFMNIHKNKHLFNVGNNTKENIKNYKNEDKMSKNEELNKNQNFNYYSKESDKEEKYNENYNENYNDNYNNNYEKHKNKYNDKYNNDKYNDKYNNDKYNENYNDKYNDKYNNDKYNDKYDDKYNDKYNESNEKYKDKHNEKYNEKYIDKYSEKFNDKYNDKYNDNYNDNYKHKKNDDSSETLNSKNTYKYTRKKPKKMMKNMELVLTNFNEDKKMRFNTEATKTTKNKKISKLKFTKDESRNNPEKNSFSNTYSDFNLGDKNNDGSKHNIIKIKSINYISNNDNSNPNNFSQNDSYKQYKVYKYVSPIKNLFSNSGNFVHKTWTNNFLYKKKNSFSNSMRKIKQYPKISQEDIDYDDESDDDDDNE